MAKQPFCCCSARSRQKKNGAYSKIVAKNFCMQGGNTRNMGNQIKLMRSFGRLEPQGLGFVVFGGFLLISMALLLISASSVVSFPSMSFWLSSHATPSDLQGELRVSKPLHTDATNQMKKPLCDTSDRRADVCDMVGDIRVHGNSSSILYISSELQEFYRIKPHPRKGDMAALSRVTEMTLKSSPKEEAPKCAVNSKVPAIIFSPAGYVGNFFHEFSDVIIPLYIASQQFNGEVQFLISDVIPWWITKYEPIMKQLSHYEMIDLSQDNVVRCYPRVILGIRFHHDMSIDPVRSGGLTMIDFGRFLRRTYDLKRETAIKLNANQAKKPRILIVDRKHTRRFTNVNEIARVAEGMGFEAVIAEMKRNLTDNAQLMNSCDVLMGVHGAGLTNLVFLPANAVVIQIVPLGALEMFCWSDYGVPALGMKMRYLQYSISTAESTLMEEYPVYNPDFPVLTNPSAILKQPNGWINWTTIYFFKQNVKLDAGRFCSTLLHTLELLRE